MISGFTKCTQLVIMAVRAVPDMDEHEVAPRLGAPFPARAGRQSLHALVSH
jgi:hypothetical protein